jgi:hypothetical protein
MAVRVTALVAVHVAIDAILVVLVQTGVPAGMQFHFLSTLSLVLSQICSLSVWLAMGNSPLPARCAVAAVPILCASIGLDLLIGYGNIFSRAISGLVASVSVPLWIVGVSISTKLAVTKARARQFTILHVLIATALIAGALGLNRVLPGGSREMVHGVAWLAASVLALTWSVLGASRPWLATLGITVVAVCAELMFLRPRGIMELTAIAAYLALLYVSFSATLAVFRASGYRLVWRSRVSSHSEGVS